MFNLGDFSMKKTLVALAALASVSAFAQSAVTLSGKLGVAYTNTQAFTPATATEAASTAKGNGFSVTDGNVTFAAVEDLGGGLKAGASMDVKVRGRNATPGTTIDGRDASVYVMGGFGRVSAGAVEAANGILSLGGAGGTMIGLDNGRVLDGGANIDFIRYDAKLGPVGVSLGMADSITNPGANGLQKAATTSKGTTVGLSYANGPLAVAADTTSFGQNSAPAAATKSRFRVSTSYDLGVAKLGFGYQTKKAFTVGAVANKQMVLGVAVPFGPATVGFNWGSNTQGTAKTTGYDLGVNYAMSKRTAIQTALLNDKSNAVGARDNRTFRVRLMHSF